MLEKLKKRLVSWTPVIALLSLTVTIMAMVYPGISSSISSYFFPKADYIVKSETTPTILPIDFRQSLSVSPEYIVVTSVNLKSNTQYQSDPLQLSISIQNEGKKLVEQPRIVVYFVDFMYRVWGFWNESSMNDLFTKGVSLEYQFPPLDQKNVGTWAVFALIYDDAESVLVSYVLKTFTVTDVAPRPWWELWGIIIAISVITIVFGLLTRFRQKRLEKKYTELQKLNDKEVKERLLPLLRKYISNPI